MSEMVHSHGWQLRLVRSSAGLLTECLRVVVWESSNFLYDDWLTPPAPANILRTSNKPHGLSWPCSRNHTESFLTYSTGGSGHKVVENQGEGHGPHLPMEGMSATWQTCLTVATPSKREWMVLLLVQATYRHDLWNAQVKGTFNFCVVVSKMFAQGIIGMNL